MTERLALAAFDRPYWAVVTGSPEFPILGGSHYGVRADVPEDHGYEWGRVFSTEHAARRHMTALRMRVAATWAALGDNVARDRGLLSEADFTIRHRLQRIMRPAGVANDVWFPAEPETVEVTA